MLGRLGAAPETAANALSLLLTVALWALVARRSIAGADTGESAWVTALPCLLLAATRSVAVWSTGGLETRLFEVLVVAGTFRLLDETTSEGRGTTLRRPWSGVLLGLATLTRPDGLLVAGAAMVTAAGWLVRRRRLAWRPWLARTGAFATLVGGPLAFRLSYYGEWVPNTYFAKVGGRFWWDMGFRYAGAFALEYAVVLWLPLLYLGVRWHRRGGTALTPALYARGVARMSGQKSELGAWLDPAADKLLLVTTFIVLTLPNIDMVNRIPILLTVLIISRDVGIVLTVAVVNLASGPRTFRPSQLGKAAKAWFLLTCVVVMFYNWRGVTSPVVDVFIWTSLAITLASGIDYVWRIGRGLK